VSRKGLLAMRLIVPNYKAWSFANVVTGDETWVSFYEPKRKHQHKIKELQ
jgi:hypothetical protein